MSDPLRQLPLELSHVSAFHMDDLVVTQSNQAAFELIEQWPNWALPIAILVGPQGAGKTHFTQAWSQETKALPVNLNKLDESLDNLSKNIPLFLENVGDDEINETALFHLINAVKEAHSLLPKATLLMTSRKLPANWNVQLSDLSSRLKSITLAEIELPDDELLTAVAYKIFADRQLNVDPQIIRFLIGRVERSLFSLNQAIEKIDLIALQRKTKINKAIISEVLSEKN